MVFSNLVHRPLRTLISVFAISIEVTLILLIVGLCLSMLNDSAKRQEGVGFDVMVSPPGSSFLTGITGAPVSMKVADKIRDGSARHRRGSHRHAHDHHRGAGGARRHRPESEIAERLRQDGPAVPLSGGRPVPGTRRHDRRRLFCRTASRQGRRPLRRAQPELPRLRHRGARQGRAPLRADPDPAGSGGLRGQGQHVLREDGHTGERRRRGDGHQSRFRAWSSTWCVRSPNTLR